MKYLYHLLSNLSFLTWKWIYFDNHLDSCTQPLWFHCEADDFVFSFSLWIQVVVFLFKPYNVDQLYFHIIAIMFWTWTLSNGFRCLWPLLPFVVMLWNTKAMFISCNWILWIAFLEVEWKPKAMEIVSKKDGKWLPNHHPKDYRKTVP